MNWQLRCAHGISPLQCRPCLTDILMEEMVLDAKFSIDVIEWAVASVVTRVCGPSETSSVLHPFIPQGPILSV